METDVRIPFKAKYHEEDSYKIQGSKYGGIKIYQMMDSGIEREFFLSREALEEMYQIYLQLKEEIEQ
jgi:hypothetical protein